MSEIQSVTIAWAGSTLDPAYSREGRVSKAGGRIPVPVSSLPAFGGDAACWNPEDLLAGAMANCHMLTFLALVHKARLEVLGYEGEAQATLETVDRISRVASIRLAPVIRVAPGTDAARVEEFFHKAHKYCVIANSFNGQVILEPRVVGA